MDPKPFQSGLPSQRDKLVQAQNETDSLRRSIPEGGASMTDNARLLESVSSLSSQLSHVEACYLCTRHVFLTKNNLPCAATFRGPSGERELGKSGLGSPQVSEILFFL